MANNPRVEFPLTFHIPNSIVIERSNIATLSNLFGVPMLFGKNGARVGLVLGNRHAFVGDHICKVGDKLVVLSGSYIDDVLGGTLLDALDDAVFSEDLFDQRERYAGYILCDDQYENDSNVIEEYLDER